MVATFARWGAVGVSCLCCVVLLVAEKTVAGASFGCIALLLAVPFSWPTRRRVARWIRAVLIAACLAVAVEGIAGTDLQPCQEKTGNPAVDKVSAIIDVFVEKVAHTRAPCGPTR